MRSFSSPLFMIRLGLVVIFLMHSIPSFYTGSVNDFGTKYLDVIGFAPVGLYLAWAVKLSHIAFAVSLVVDKFVKPIAWITIAILVVGIAIVHWPNGWYVVGGGSSGIEYNILLILCTLTVIYPHGLMNSSEKK